MCNNRKCFYLQLGDSKGKPSAGSRKKMSMSPVKKSADDKSSEVSLSKLNTLCAITRCVHSGFEIQKR